MMGFGFFDILDAASFINIVIQAIWASRSLDEIFITLSFPYEVIYNGKRKKEWRSSPPFRSKYLWRIILKRVGETLSPPICLLPSASLTSNDPYKGYYSNLFQELPLKLRLPPYKVKVWKEYLLIFDMSTFTITDGKISHLIQGRFDTTTHYFLLFNKGIFKLFTETPWNHENLVMEGMMESYVGEGSTLTHICISETVYGLMIVFCTLEGRFKKLIYRMEEGRLRYVSSGYSDFMTFPSSWGILEFLNYDAPHVVSYINPPLSKNYYPIMEKIFSRVTGRMERVQFEWYSCAIPEISIFKIGSYSVKTVLYIAMQYSSEEVLWSYSSELNETVLPFDLFIFIGKRVHDLYTGKVLFTCNEGIYPLRKKDCTGYFLAYGIA